MTGKSLKSLLLWNDGPRKNGITQYEKLQWKATFSKKVAFLMQLNFRGDKISKIQ